MRRRIAQLVVIITSIFALALTGCSAHRQLVTQAVSFNLTVEKAQNEMLLLNVLRAKDRLPMYVTGISTLNGNFQSAFSSSLSGNYSHLKGSSDTIGRSLTPSASATMSANPSFSLAVLDTQEFMKGFLNPISKKLLAYYWDQGWRPELLLYFLVQRVEIVVKVDDTTRKTFVFENYPESEKKDPDKDPHKLEHFGCWLHEFLAQKPRIVQEEVPKNVGLPVAKSSVGKDVSTMMSIDREGLFLKDDGNDNYQLQRLRADWRFRLEKPAPDVLAWISKCSGPSEQETLTGETKRSQQDYYQLLADAEAKMGVTAPEKLPPFAITFVLRSPEGLVYYLGELARVANRSDSPQVPYVCIQGRYQPLFVALPAGHCEDPLLEVDSGRGSFAVPPASAAETDKAHFCDEGDRGKIQFEPVQCESGRSLHALNLLSQLMSLQKSAKDLPSTAVVRVID